MMRAKVLVAILLLANGPAATEEATRPADANLFIYREHAEPTIWSPTIKIDDQKLVALGNRRYTATHLLPGTYKIKLIWPFLSGQRNAEMDVTIAEGETRYVEVTGISQLSGVGYQTYYFTLGSGIADVRPEHARVVIGRCCEFRAGIPN